MFLIAQSVLRFLITADTLQTTQLVCSRQPEVYTDGLCSLQLATWTPREHLISSTKAWATKEL